MTSTTARNSNPLHNERVRVPRLMIAFTLTTATGFLTWWLDRHGDVHQWLVLLHLVAGLVLSVLIFPYLGGHFRRTIGFRRAGMIASGLAILLLAAAVIITGLWLGADAVIFTNRHIYATHIGAAVLSLLLVAAHLWGHRLGLPSNRKQRHEDFFPSLKDIVARPIFMAVSAGAALIALLTLISSFTRMEFDNLPAVADYDYPYGDHPFRPSQTETADGAFVDSKEIAQSKDCRNCHPVIYDQWQRSPPRRR